MVSLNGSVTPLKVRATRRRPPRAHLFAVHPPQAARGQRRLQFRNRYLRWCKNETASGLAHDVHRIALYALLALGHVLVRERQLVRAYVVAARALPEALRRRRAVQRRRAVDRPPFGLRPGA
jgi:hypothetical protein